MQNYTYIGGVESHEHIGLSEIMKCPELSKVYQRGIDSYDTGISYQWCPEIRGSIKEYVWEKGWDSKYIGDVPGISSYRMYTNKAKV